MTIRSGIEALISRSKPLARLLHSLSVTTHQERNYRSDTGRNPSPDRHRFSQEQWNSLIYRNKTRPHHNGDPIGHEPCISIFNRIFNRTQMPHYGFLSHQVYSSEFPAHIFMMVKLFPCKWPEPPPIPDTLRAGLGICNTGRMTFSPSATSTNSSIPFQFVASSQSVY